MKTLTISAILILISIICTGQKKLTPIVEFESGYGQRFAKLDEYCNKNDLKKSSLYSNFIIGVKYKNFNLSTNTYTYFNNNSNIYFSPWLAVYDIEFTYTYKLLVIGVNHECIHPILNSQDNFFYSSTYDHIYLKIKFK